MTELIEPEFELLPKGSGHIADAYAEAALEDRCAPRTKLQIPAKLRLPGNSGFNVDVIDLSIAGCACAAYIGAHPGTRCWLTLPGLGSLEAEIVRNDGSVIGCAFSTFLNPAVLAAFVDRFGVGRYHSG